MNTERRVFKMAAHQEEQVGSVIFSVSSVEEDKERRVQEKLSQSSLKSRSPSMKFTMVVWKTLKSKDIEIVRIVMVREDKTYKNVPNVKDKELFKSLSNLVQVCTHNHLKDVEIVKVKEKLWKNKTDVKNVRVKKLKKSRRYYK